MSRLIDADALMEEIKSLQVSVTGLRAGKGILNEYAKMYRESLLRIIDEQPTAFDMERVVEELHNFSLNTELYCNEMTQEGICTEFTDCDYCKLQKAIDIVKKGGAE